VSQGYWDSIQGQRHRFWGRRDREVHIDVRREPRQKRRGDDEVAFRREAKARRVSKREPPWWPRAPVALDITFQTSRKQPPGIQRLTKHYLDLLGATSAPPEEPGPVVYVDDKQVKLLHVSCFRGTDSKQSVDAGISVLARPRSGVVEEFEQLGDLRWLDPDFEEDHDDHWSSLLASRGGNAWELAELERSFADSSPPFEAFRLRQLQEDLLLQADRIVGTALLFNARRLLVGGVPRRERELLGLGDVRLAEQLNNIAAWNSLRNRLSASFQVRIPPLPVRRGDSATFKAASRESCRRFLRRFSVLTPLLVPLRACILVVPPDRELAGAAFTKDLDNIALTLIGVVEEEFGLVADPQRATHPHGLSSFQVIELARTETDPPEGWVALVPGLGWNSMSYWHEAAHLNDQILERLADRR
jgi:hypothetical protein